MDFETAVVSGTWAWFGNDETELWMIRFWIPIKKQQKVLLKKDLRKKSTTK